MMKPNLTYALLLLVSLTANPALGAPGGELDPDFGDHGRILLRDAPFAEFAGVEVFVDPASGKLTVVADGYGSDRLLRFNSDGSLDQGFGDQGTALLDFGDDDLDISDVLLLPDHKLLIAGVMNVYGTAAADIKYGTALLARMHADGTPDLSFGRGGRAEFQLGGIFEQLTDIFLQEDGRIIVFGNTNRTRRTEWILARYTQDGMPDSSFGNAASPGIRVVDFAGINASPKDIAQQSDGKFLVCGDAQPIVPGPHAILAARVSPGGLPDPTFGNNGLILISGQQELVEVNACQELADGHLIFAGSSGSRIWQQAAVWRIAPDGRLDRTFGTDGMTLLNTDTPSTASAMTIMADGTLALAGAQWKGSTRWLGSINAWIFWSDMLIARLDPTTGAVDQNFGNHGKTVVDFGTRDYSSNAHSASVTQQPDGKLLVVGAQIDMYDWYPFLSIAMARIDPDGSGSNGWASVTESFVHAPADGGLVELVLRRTGGSTGELSVDFDSMDDTATSGEDYVATHGTLTWPNGDSSDKIISISVSTEHLVTDSEKFRVDLSNSNGGLGMDQTTVYLRRTAPSSVSPPDRPGGRNVKGGGALGVELFLLLILLSVPLVAVPGTRSH